VSDIDISLISILFNRRIRPANHFYCVVIDLDESQVIILLPVTNVNGMEVANYIFEDDKESRA